MLAVALLLDALFGEPEWIWRRVPHPAVLMGRTVRWLDRIFNQSRGARAGGVIASFRIGPMPVETATSNLELFMTKVAPHFRTAEAA